MDLAGHSFPYPFPPAFDAAFFKRFGSDRGVRAGLLEMIEWLNVRTLECLAYEETQRWPDQLQAKAHAARVPAGGGRRGCSAALPSSGSTARSTRWRSGTATTGWTPQRFVGRALPETAAMAP